MFVFVFYITTSAALRRIYLRRGNLGLEGCCSDQGKRMYDFQGNGNSDWEKGTYV